MLGIEEVCIRCVYFHVAHVREQVRGCAVHASVFIGS